MDLSQYDRITSILSPFSGMDKIPKSILEAAADRGTRVHALCNGIIEGIEIDVPDEYKGYVDSFLQWKEGKLLLPSTGRMFDDDLMITGECDGTYIKDAVPTIFDLKTSQKESKTWPLQGAGYSLLDGKKFQTFVILDKHGGSPREFHYSFKENIVCFMKCLDLYRLFFKNKKNDLEEYEYL